MSASGARPLFVDTGAFYARADRDDANHESAVRFFGAIRDGDLPYRPVYTSQAVCSELATLLLRKLGHAAGVRVLNSIRESASITVLPVDRPAFVRAAEQFADYADHTISFVDHSSAVLAEDRDVRHVFAYDSDFRTLEFTLVPADVRGP